jgi:hypothetical protein
MIRTAVTGSATLSTYATPPPSACASVLADQFERSLPVRGADQLQGARIKAGAGHRGRDDLVEERGGGPQGGSPGAQHPGVAGLQQLRRHVDGDVRPGLEIRAHHPDRQPALGEPQPPGQFAQVGALRGERGVGQQPDLAGHVGDPAFVQPQPVDQPRAQPAGFGIGHVGGIGGEEALGPPGEQFRHRPQGAVNGLIGGQGQAWRPISG